MNAAYNGISNFKLNGNIETGSYTEALEDEDHSLGVSTSLPCSSSSSSDPGPTIEWPFSSWVICNEKDSIMFVCMWKNCFYALNSKQELSVHLSTHFDYYCSENRQSSHWPCQIVGCANVTDNASKFMSHISMHRYHALSQFNGLKLLNNNKEFSTTQSCGFEASLNVNLIDECTYCYYDHCGLGFRDICEFFEHVTFHIDLIEVSEKSDGKFICRWDNCYKQCGTKKGDIRRHISYHSGEKCCACPFCGSFFSRTEKFYEHLRRKLPEDHKPYVCMLCQKTFPDETLLSHHVRRHLNTVQCRECGLALSVGSDLEKHMIARHSERERNFSCDKCSAKFYNEYDLMKHGSIHIPPQLACHLCGKMFRWKVQLDRHIAKHENLPEKGYLCHICEKKYSTGHHLTRHLISSHGCPIPEGFSRFNYKKCNDGFHRLQTKKLMKGPST